MLGTPSATMLSGGAIAASCAESDTPANRHTALAVIHFLFMVSSLLFREAFLIPEIIEHAYEMLSSAHVTPVLVFPCFPKLQCSAKFLSPIAAKSPSASFAPAESS